MSKKETEAERIARWQQHYEEFMDSIPPHRHGITTIDAAERYADEMMEEEDKEENE